MNVQRLDLALWTVENGGAGPAGGGRTHGLWFVVLWSWWRTSGARMIGQVSVTKVDGSWAFVAHQDILCSIV
jgi:hypothetical protein